MKTINRIFLYISMVLVMIYGIYAILYEYFLWDRSLIPQGVDQLFHLIGCSALLVLFVTCYIDKKLDR